MRAFPFFVSLLLAGTALDAQNLENRSSGRMLWWWRERHGASMIRPLLLKGGHCGPEISGLE